MPAPVLSISRRTRRTPFSRRVEAAGVSGYTVYNHMLLPTVFESVEADYHHLKSRVQVWDVSCERQVEIRGPDAGRLVQFLTPRDLGRMTVGQCLYTPMVDEVGGMLNDPVTVKLADDRYWVSIADSDLLLWIKAIAFARDFDVEVDEPDVSPLAVQGPRADDLMARVFGEEVRNIRFFRFARLAFHGQELVVARSGYSRQGGFEIYLEPWELGEPLWDALFEAGADLDVRAGGPNLIERVEGGLLSYGNDMTRANSPFECGLGRFCAPGPEIDCIGGAWLRREAAAGPARQIRGIAIPGAPLPPCREPWTLRRGDDFAGEVTSVAFSPDLGFNVAIGMVEAAFWEIGTSLTLETPDGARTAEVRELPFG